MITHSFIQTNYSINYFWKFLLKRIIRIEPAYLFVLLLGIFYLIARNVMLSFPWNEGLDVLRIFAHIGYLVPFMDKEWINIVFWTLAIEFQFYLVFALIFPLIKKQNWILILLCIPAILSWNHFETIFSFISIFNLGILLALHYNKKIERISFIIYSVLCIGIIIFNFGFVILFFALSVFLVVLFSLKIESKILSFFGKISYSLYLIHTLVAFAMINIANKFPISTISQIIVTALVLVFTIVTSYLMYIFIEKPTIEWSKKIKYNEKSQ